MSAPVRVTTRHCTTARGRSVIVGAVWLGLLGTLSELSATPVPAGLKLPEAVAGVEPRPLRKPGRIVPWKVLVAREEVPVFTDAEGKGRLLAGVVTPKLGEALYVVAVAESPATVRRFLLGRFERDGDQFTGWVGWVEECWVLDESSPVSVARAGEVFTRLLGSGHPLAAQVVQWLPPITVARPESRRLPLKAVTHPERGRVAFPMPLPPDERASLARSDRVVHLPPFAFLYVYQFAVLADRAYVLVSYQSELRIEETLRIRERIAGWLDVEDVLLWPSRDALEIAQTAPALEARRRAGRPVELFASEKDLRAWAAWELAGRVGRAPAEPVYREVLDAARAPAHLLTPWPSQWMRYPVLASYPLSTGRPPSGLREPWLGHRIGVLGTLDGTRPVTAASTGVAHAGEGRTTPTLTPAQRAAVELRVSEAADKLRIVELVLVIDSTGSMEPAMPSIAQAVRQLVNDLRAAAARGREEFDKLQLRVAGVLYKDHESRSAFYLTQTTESFFDVMTDAGMAAFDKWMSQIDTQGGGGDAFEEPFEGIAEAVRKFLAPSGSAHTPGAMRMILLVGDGGNADPAINPKTRLRIGDVAKMLEATVTERIAGGSFDTGKIALYSVLALVSATHDSSPQARRWKEQFPDLCARTGGSAQSLSFHTPLEAERSTGKMFALLQSALSARREQVRTVLTKFRELLLNDPTSASSGSGTVSGGPALVGGGAGLSLARDRLTELLGREEAARLTRGPERTYLAVLHAVELAPGDSIRQPRMRSCVLLTEQEFIKLQTACQVLGQGLDDELNSGVLPGPSDKLELKIKEVLIRTMLSAFGETVTASRVNALMVRNLPDVQAETSNLPVLFTGLQVVPPDEKALRELAEDFKFRTSQMLEVVSRRRDRFFVAGPNSPEKHIWVYKDELP